MNEPDTLARAQTVIGYQFNEPDLLGVALTHSSTASSRLVSNERLEFLGDAVLGLVVCDALYRRFKTWHEGELTRVKSAVVSRRACAMVSDELGLTGLLALGGGLDVNGAIPGSLRAAVYESVIGALYVDGGLKVAEEFILRTMGAHIQRYVCSETTENFKSALQQYAQRHLSAAPAYESLDEQGPDHSKCFEVAVVIGGMRFPSAWGPSKKQAEQEAARRALDTLHASRDPASREASP